MCVYVIFLKYLYISDFVTSELPYHLNRVTCVNFYLFPRYNLKQLTRNLERCFAFAEKKRVNLERAFVHLHARNAFALISGPNVYQGLR